MRHLISCTVWSFCFAVSASAQDLPQNPPDGMDPLSAIFVEACASYTRGERAEIEILPEQGFVYVGPVRPPEGRPEHDHSAVYRSTWDSEVTQLERAQIQMGTDFHLTESGEEMRAYFCRLIVHEQPELQIRFRPESFYQLEDFEDYIPPDEDQARGITDAWELHANGRYTAIQSGSPEPNLWVTLIYSYPMTRITHPADE